MNTNNSIINALKRLERNGLESSKTTLKLKEAVIELADYIASLDGIVAIVDDIANDGHVMQVLPRDYAVGWPGEDRRSDVYLYSPESPSTRTRTSLSSMECDCAHGSVGLTREAALRFAEDIADGWLDELADWLEQRTAKDTAAAQALDQARKDMQS